MKKNKRSVLVSLYHEEGKLRLNLDDVVQIDNGLWKKADHFTSKLIDTKEFDNLSFDEKELADFGYHILARLSAFKKLNEI